VITGGFVITSGEFSDTAKAFAQGLNIQLFNGIRLNQLICKALQPPAAATAQPFAPVSAADPASPK